MYKKFPPWNDHNAQCFESMMINDCAVVGIKKMGQLDEKPFHYACKRKHRDDDPEGKAARLVSSWQEELNNISWNPFITSLVDGEEKVQDQFMHTEY